MNKIERLPPELTVLVVKKREDAGFCRKTLVKRTKRALDCQFRSPECKSLMDFIGVFGCSSCSFVLLLSF